MQIEHKFVVNPPSKSLQLKLDTEEMANDPDQTCIFQIFSSVSKVTGAVEECDGSRNGGHCERRKVSSWRKKLAHVAWLLTSPCLWELTVCFSCPVHSFNSYQRLFSMFYDLQNKEMKCNCWVSA